MKRQRNNTSERLSAAIMKRKRRNDTSPLPITSSTRAEWESLPLPVIFVILDKLSDPIDHVVFASVCKPWLSLVKDYNQTRPNNNNKAVPPMFLVQHEQGGELYCASKGKIYSCDELPQLPPFSTTSFNAGWLCGSSHGWLAMAILDIDEAVFIELRNPFRNSSAIRLPSIKVGRLYEISKVTLSVDPDKNPDNYVVAALYNNHHGNSKKNLAYMRARQESWTYIDPDLLVADFIFHKGNIYAIDLNGELMSLNVDIYPPQVKILTTELPRSETSVLPHPFLVESTKGDLLVLTPAHSGRFMVYKVAVLSENDVQVVEVKNIGHEALFVGVNFAPVSVLASNFTDVYPNTVYYNTCSPYTLNCVVSSQNVEDGIITKEYDCWRDGRLRRNVWIVPSFNGLC